MAFLSKIGNMLRQATSTQINTQLSASRPGLFQVFRCMSTSPSSKLFVGGISYQTDEQSLREAFSKYGEVVDARVIVDRETGRSRGFAFVTYTSSEDASSALQALDGQLDVIAPVLILQTGQGNYSSGGYGQSAASTYDGGSFNVAGGGGGSDGFGTGGSGGFGGGDMGFGGGDQQDTGEGSFKDEPEGFQNDPLNENFRDEDDTNDFAKRA
ncbi:hypothetical protein COLO4_06855 [Corchorus olitorius]|uniref:RRM domain-containing protein n=1 Tax=Corchorus olitorius TaxID=93759 RepID=A0A1R3KLQ0_9ROSI|nr:hypothetical protein COLO4_06855 [Corchorus olitorius]